MPVNKLTARPTPPRVYAVLLNWNDSAETLRCVESLRRSRYPSLTIVVVDNGSRPDDFSLLSEKLPRECHLLPNPTNAGFAEGNNIGARFATDEGADYVLVLNNDAVVDPDAVTRLVDAALADELVGIASPVILLASKRKKVVFPRFVHGWPPLLYFLLGTLAGMELLPARMNARGSRLGTVDGCCFLIRRAAIPEMGLFDPLFFFGGYESTDLCMKVFNGGLKVIGVRDALVWADRGDRRRSALLYSYWSPRNRIIFARKNLNILQFMTFLLLLPLHILSWIGSWGLWSGRDFRVVWRVGAGIWTGFREDLRSKDV